MLDLFTRGLILFTSFLKPNFNNSITMLISSPLQNYLPQVTRTEAFEELVLLQYFAESIIIFQYCYFVKRRLHHFCVALTVTRKFRLCLQPHGLLRVQSLHLPIAGLGSAFSAFILYHNEQKKAIDHFYLSTVKAPEFAPCGAASGGRVFSAPQPCRPAQAADSPAVGLPVVVSLSAPPRS